jgi:hypothetical protein
MDPAQVVLSWHPVTASSPASSSPPAGSPHPTAAQSPPTPAAGAKPSQLNGSFPLASTGAPLIARLTIAGAGLLAAGVGALALVAPRKRRR